MQPPLPAPDSLPDALLPWPNFVCWKYVERDGKPTKVPLTLHGTPASTTDPATWATIEEAYPAARAHGWGVGFVFSPADPFCGIDLDKVAGPGGALTLEAARIVDDLATYTELSPSGTGLHLIAAATLPPGGRRTGNVELYDRARFFTLTGNALPVCSTVEYRQTAVEQLHARLFPIPPAPAPPRRTAPPPGQLSDPDVIERALGAANGAKFRRLWDGDWSGYGSHSEADAALCSLLAFWVGPDPERVAQLFRQSALYREKWERATYREHTLALVADRREYYTPRPSARRVYLGG